MYVWLGFFMCRHPPGLCAGISWPADGKRTGIKKVCRLSLQTFNSLVDSR